MNILFVCTGNTCRSPMAEGICAKLYTLSNIVVSSAGLYADEGAMPNENAVTAMKMIDIDITHHRAKNVTTEQICAADIIYVMTKNAAEILISRFPKAAKKIHVMPGEISDPYGRGLDEYLNCAKQLYKIIADKSFADSIKS